MICQICAATSLYYRDDTNAAYYCKRCYSGTERGRMSNKVLEGELFKSYREALEASNREIAEAIDMRKTLLATRIETVEQEQWASDVGGKLAKIVKAIEARRDEAKKPWWDNYKAIQDAPKKALDVLQEIIDHLKSEIKRSVAARTAAQAPALEALAAAGASPTEIARTAAATTAAAPDGTQLRDAWTWQMADGGEPPANMLEAFARGYGQIPASYFILDTDRLDREARALKETFAVACFKPKKDPTVAFV